MANGSPLENSEIGIKGEGRRKMREKGTIKTYYRKGLSRPPGDLSLTQVFAKINTWKGTHGKKKD